MSATETVNCISTAFSTAVNWGMTVSLALLFGYLTFQLYGEIVDELKKI